MLQHSSELPGSLLTMHQYQSVVLGCEARILYFKQAPYMIFEAFDRLENIKEHDINYLKRYHVLIWGVILPL